MATDRCGCGSGLRALRCCALPEHAAPDESALPWLQALLDQAAQAAERRDPAAETMLLAVLELAPNSARGLKALCLRRGAEGNAAAVRALLQRYVSFHPNDIWGRSELAMALIGAGETTAALEHARNAVRLAPGEPRAHDVLGMVLIEANRPIAGAAHCARAVELSGGRDPILLANMAWGLKAKGDLAGARAAYQKAAAIAPPTVQILLGHGQTEMADRQYDVAAMLLDRAAALAPDHAGVRLARAALLERRGDHAGALGLLAGDATPDMLLARGRMLDRVGQYDAAFACFTAANAQARQLGGKSYPDATVAAIFGRLRDFYTPQRMALLPRAPLRADSPQPVFIMGFPRSGTTMLEQMLSCHARIAAGDELPLLADLTETAPRLLGSPLFYPEALSEVWMEDCRDGMEVLRDHYLRGARQMGAMAAGKPRFTDKMPLNETHLGLASLLFPQSPIIHVLRHPLDVVLSVFSNLLTHGYHCASALESAALHYARVAELVAHQRAAVAPNYLAVRYEDIVAAPETQLRKIFDFIGEEFEPDCLIFHQNTRYARTASEAQVTEPLYDRSVYRWRHYRAQLAGVIPVLEPAIRALGYELY